MRIRFLRNVTADVETRTGEIFDKAFYRWEEIRVQSIFPMGDFATIRLNDGMVYLNLPLNAFEEIPEEKPPVSL